MPSKVATSNSSSGLASWILPSLDQLGAKAKQVLPGAIAIGAAGGGLQYIASQLAQYEQDRLKREQAERGNSDVLTVQIPAKTAGVLDMLGKAIQGVSRSWGNGTIPKVLAGTAGATVGATAGTGIDRAAQAAPPGAIQGGLEVAEKLVAPLSNVNPSAVLDNLKQVPKQIAATTVPEPAPAPVKPNVLWDSGMGLGLGLGGLALGYGAVNAFTRNRRLSEEKAKLEAAKREYSSLLGQSLAGPKIASVLEFPCIEGLVAGASNQLDEMFPSKTASGALDILGAPGMLAVLAGIVGHQFVYNRETAADNALKQPRIKPPKSIRLVTAPAPAPAPALEAGDATQAIKDEEDKVAAYTNLDVIDYLIKQAEPITDALSAGVVEMLPSKTPTSEPTDPASFKPRVEQIDANTIVIHTASGPITVYAADHQARALLQQKNKQLARSMSAATAIPAE